MFNKLPKCWREYTASARQRPNHGNAHGIELPAVTQRRFNEKNQSKHTNT